jgi:hypothetical protein
MRHVLCHYHIYKNAGTSFDRILADSFGERHLSFDGPFPFFIIDQEQLDRIIQRKREALAFSSHQIQLPAPVSRDYRVVPVVFLRDPMLRIASVYRFKRAGRDGTLTAKMAGDLTLGGWIAAALDHPEEIVHVSNAQTRLLSARARARAEVRRAPDRMEYDLRVAKENLAAAGFVGRTEHFACDVRTLSDRIARFGLRLRTDGAARLNATAPDHVAPEAAREAMRSEIGEQLWDRLIAANEQDIALRAEADRRAAASAEAA